jgi:hypothetical protein
MSFSLETFGSGSGRVSHLNLFEFDGGHCDTATAMATTTLLDLLFLEGSFSWKARGLKDSFYK